MILKEPNMGLLIIWCMMVWLKAVESEYLDQTKNFTETTELDMRTESPPRGSGQGCLRFRFDSGSLTARKLQVMFCYTSFNTGSESSPHDILECMDTYGIKPDDDDMADVVIRMPQVSSLALRHPIKIVRRLYINQTQCIGSRPPSEWSAGSV